MASETLSLFPSPASSVPPKSCLDQVARTRAACKTVSPTLSSKSSSSVGIRGLALQLTPQSGNITLMEPASGSIKHSLFCSPVSIQSADEIELQSRASPSPSNTPCGHKKRPGKASRKASENTTSSETRSVLSGSPTLVRSNSGSSIKQRSVSPPMRSIFPEYDSSVPLSQQHYYPTEAFQRPRLQRREDSAIQLPSETSSTSSVPVAGLSQLQALWNAANGQSPANLHAGKVRLAMHCDDIGAGSTAREIRFGSLEGRTLYSVSTSDSSKELTMRRHHPARTAILPIAQVDLTTLQEEQAASTTVFAQQAALAALEAAATTHKANSIAQFDPRASSPQAAQLAFDAVADAKQQESCQLVRIPNGPNRFGQEEDRYELRHPQLGVLQMSIEGEVNLFKKDKSKSEGKSKISIHHPYASPVKLSSMPPVLLSLDLTAEVLDIDVTAFRELENRYIIDTCISAALATAITESARKQADTSVPQSFAAPPVSSAQDSKDSKKKKSKDSCWRRVMGKKKQKAIAQPSTEKKEEKLPGVTRGMLYMLGFSFEAIVWLLGLGVKVLSRLIVCISAVVSKR